MNKVILLGNLTRDPELRHVGSGTPVCNFSMAHNRRWKDGNGKEQEEVTFVDLTAWGTLAETIAKHCRKGKQLLIDGRLRFDRYEDEQKGEQVTRTKLSVTVEQFQFVGKADAK